MVPQYYMLLCPCVYGFELYGHLNNSCLLFCFVISVVKQKMGKIDDASVFI